MVLFVDGVIVYLDFERGGYASKMRTILRQHRINRKEDYDAVSLTITERLTKT